MGGKPLDANECTGGKGDLGKDQEKGRGRQGKKVRLEYWSLNGLGGVRIDGWVPGPQDGNLNLEPHPQRTTSCVDRMTTTAREVTQQRKQPCTRQKT